MEPEPAPTPVPEPALQVAGLTVVYGPKVAVDGIDFQIERGEIFGLLGPNGAGKTSALGAIEGLISPRAGTVLVDGIDARQHPIDAKARLGVQLQSSSFQPELSIEQIAMLYGGLYGAKLTTTQVRDGLEDIGLGEERGKRFKQLSGDSNNDSRSTSQPSTTPRSCCSTSRRLGWTRSRGAPCGAVSSGCSGRAPASC